MNDHKYLMLACAVLARECYHCAAKSKNLIDLRIIEQGLHDIGEEKMSSALQREIDALDQEKYEAILLGYGLCNNGIRNLHANIPIVLPRAHDCITLLMGSNAGYLKYFSEHPGTFFRSVGWAERSSSNLSNPQSTTREMGISTYEEYVENFGEENARYLMDILNDHLRNYTRLAYIDTGLPNAEVHEKAAKEWAKEQGWEYSMIQGGMRLILKLMDGEWNEDEFLVVNPGQAIDASHDDDVIKVKEFKNDINNKS
jgi:hypothetical protein